MSCGAHRISRKGADRWTGTFTVDGTLQQHSRHGDSGQAAFYAGGPFIPELLNARPWGRGLKRQEDAIVTGTPAWQDVDLTGRLTFTPNEDHDIVLEAGRTRLRRESAYGNTVAEAGRASGALPETVRGPHRRHALTAQHPDAPVGAGCLAAGQRRAHGRFRRLPAMTARHPADP